MSKKIEHGRFSLRSTVLSCYALNLVHKKHEQGIALRVSVTIAKATARVRSANKVNPYVTALAFMLRMASPVPMGFFFLSAGLAYTLIRPSFFRYPGLVKRVTVAQKNEFVDAGFA